MALDRRAICPAGVVTSLNTSAGGSAVGDTDVTMVGGVEIMVLATNANVPPVAADFYTSGQSLHMGQGWISTTLAQAFAGITTPLYLWALAIAQDGAIKYSHA